MKGFAIEQRVEGKASTSASCGGTGLMPDKPVMWMTVDGLTFPIGEIE